MTLIVKLQSDDGTLEGNLTHYCGDNYHVYIYKRIDYQEYHGFVQHITTKVFGNGVDAEDYLLKALECPVFTILQNR